MKSLITIFSLSYALGVSAEVEPKVRCVEHGIDSFYIVRESDYKKIGKGKWEREKYCSLTAWSTNKTGKDIVCVPDKTDDKYNIYRISDLKKIGSKHYEKGCTFEVEESRNGKFCAQVKNPYGFRPWLIEENVAVAEYTKETMTLRECLDLL